MKFIPLLFILTLTSLLLLSLSSSHNAGSRWYPGRQTEMLPISYPGILNQSENDVPEIHKPPGSIIMNYEIIGDKIFINDSNLYMSQVPHTTSGNADIQLQTKSFTGNIDLVFGFNTTENVLPTGVSVFNPRNITTQTNHSYTCETNYFNYTLSPKHFWCWKNVTDYINGTGNTTIVNGSHLELVYDHDFDTGNIPLKTAYWSSTETHQEDWQDFSKSFQSINYNYGGNNKWYYARNLPVIAGKMYDINMELDIPPKLGTSYGKYWICTKPSSETIAQAIANSHLYCIDTWWNSS